MDYLKELSILEGELKSSSDRTSGAISNFLKHIKSSEEALEDDRHEIKVLETLVTVMDKFISVSNEDTLNEIKDLINQGLRLAFPEATHQIEAEYKLFRGSQVISFYFIKNGQVENIKDAQSGGMLDLVSLLFRVLLIYKLETKRVIFLDEALNGISDFGEYSKKASTLISSICEKKGFSICLVTHKENLSAGAHNSYFGSCIRASESGEIADTLVLTESVPE